MLVLSLLLALSQPSTPAPNPRAAFFYTGRGLRDVCIKNDDISLGLCVGYMDSVLDRLLFSDTYKTPRRVCLSDKATNDVVRKAVLAEFAKAPDELNLPAFFYVERAAAAAFPCAAQPAASSPR